MSDQPRLEDVILELWDLRAEMIRAADADRQAFISELRHNLRGRPIPRRRSMAEFTQRQIRLGEEILANAYARSRDTNLEKP